MASRELYSSIGKPKPKKLNFGQQIGEYGKVLADTALSGIGMSDVISDEAYKADWAKKVSSITSPLANVAGSIAPMLMGAPTGPAIFAKGGLRTFEGPSHEQGGIQLAGDEVEGNETMVPMDSQSDFIFSDRLYPIKSISPKGKITFSKKSFAQLSKQINKPLELRPNDPYAKKTADIKLGKLAQEQEALKQSNNTEQFAMGGKRYFGGGKRYPNTFPALYNSPLSEEGYVDDIPANVAMAAFPDTVPEATFGMYNDGMGKMPTLGAQINPSAGKFKTESLGLAQKPEPPQQPYKSNFTLPTLGYAAQALTNIPALFTKPDTINSSRVKFKDINLAEQRNEARRSRNLGLASARGIGGNDTGQMMNYLSGTTAALNSVYGNQFNQSLLQEQQANAEMNMREQLANSEIERYDEQINAQERDAARALRMDALQNLGTIAAGAGRDYMAMQENDAMMNVLMGSNPDYTFDVNAPTGRMKWLKSKTLTPKRRKNNG